MTQFQDYLADKHACLKALQWVGDRTLEQAWTECERGDWMLWLAEKSCVGHERIILAVCDCVQTTWKYCDDEMLTAMMLYDHVVREWCEGRASIMDVRATRTAVVVAATGGGAAATAACAAVKAASAYISTALAYYAADAVAYAIDAAADDDAQEAALMECAWLVRERIPMALLATAITPEKK